MIENGKILEDISILTAMCHSKNDGPTLKIEESEIRNKLAEYEQEIQEIKITEAEDSYDTSAEMADRNIEIITKKAIQSLTSEIKILNTELESIKEEEEELSTSLNGLKRTEKSYEKYITSLKERLTTTEDTEATDRYNNIIVNTEEKIVKQKEKIDELERQHNVVQDKMEEVSNKKLKLEEKLESKKSILAEAQKNLENKDVYIDKAKKEKNEKRIKEIEEKKEFLNNRLESITKDPKYLELRIREVLGSVDNYEARNYLIELLSIASKVPFMDEYADNSLEEKLLKATKERDDFASEIDSKTYDIMDTISPEQIRIEFLNSRIAFWHDEVTKLQEKVSSIDKDENFNYTEKEKTIEELIQKLKEETKEFKAQYDKESDNNLSNKAILKYTYEEKKEDLAAAEEIASKFRKNEAEDAEEAGKIVKNDIEKYNAKIEEAKYEINKITERLNKRKSGTKDLAAKNRDREELTKLAQVVIDIKHRRQFADRVYDIAERLENNLGIKLIDAVYSKEDKEAIKNKTRVENQPNIEASVEEQPIEETQVIENSEPVVAETPIEEEVPISIDEPTPVEVTSLPTEEAPSIEDNTIETESPTEEETTIETTEIPAEEKVEEEVPVEVVPEDVEEPTASLEEVVPNIPVEEIPVEEVSVEEVPTEETPVEEVPVVDPIDEGDEPIADLEPISPIVTETVPIDVTTEIPVVELPSTDQTQETTIPSISIDNTNIPVAEEANEEIVPSEEPQVEEVKIDTPVLPIAEPSVDYTPTVDSNVLSPEPVVTPDLAINIPSDLQVDDPIAQIDQNVIENNS